MVLLVVFLNKSLAVIGQCGVAALRLLNRPCALQCALKCATFATNISIYAHIQMRELHQALQGEQRLKLEAVPVRQYESVMSLVNTCRSTLGLGSLPESQAWKAVKERTGDGHG